MYGAAAGVAFFFSGRAGWLCPPVARRAPRSKPSEKGVAAGSYSDSTATLALEAR